MALLTLTFADSYGRLKRKRIEMQTQATLADYEAVIDAFVPDLQAVTDLALVRVDLIIEAIHAGFDVTAGANVDVGATFSGYVYNGNGKKASLKLPGVKAGVINPDGMVDMEDADIVAFLQWWVHDTPYDLELSDGEHIESWIAGSLDK